MNRVKPHRNALIIGVFALLSCQASLAATPAEGPAGSHLFNSLAYSQPMDASANNTASDIGPALGGIRSLLPVVPPLGEVAVLPRIQRVQPTGEKPLYVLTFKCPTEVVGITPPPTKLLHNLVTSGMETINGANLLPFNMQQVCQ